MFRNIARLGRTYRHIGRYREIVAILIKYGFGDLMASLNLDKYLGFSRKLNKSIPHTPTQHISRWERIRLALEELGPTFIKLGQVMSNRPDLLPPALIRTLEKLQDDVPSFATESAVAVIEQEFGRPISEVFPEFEDRPVASASVSQVHRARLADGEQVAVKVQRPKIRDTIKVDVEIMYHLAALMEKYMPGLEQLAPVTVVQEFEKTIHKELDFSIEAFHIDRFRECMGKEPYLYIPQVHRELCTRRVLVTEFINGIKVSRLDLIDEAGLNARVVAERGADLVLKQIFEVGFFHADPHPGNILLLPDNVICFLDYGMVGTLSASHRDYLGAIIIALVEKDAQKITRVLSRLSQAPVESAHSLEMQVGELVEEYAYLPLHRLNVGEALNKLLKLIVTNKLRMMPGFYLLLKALVTIEGVGRRLDPDFDMVKHMEPFVRQLLREKLSPKRLLHDAYFSALELAPMLRQLPGEFSDMLGIIKNGHLRIEFAHRGLEPMLRLHDDIVNRLVFGVVLASLIIGSSLVVLSGIPPTWHGIPIIGLVGFLTAAIMGFWLLIGMMRTGKIKSG